MTDTISPIELFNTWYGEHLSVSQSPVPAACCLSTVGMDGFPNARFVALKAVHNEKFVITGPLNSRKFDELATNNRAALTFWWQETQKQIRIQGYSSPVSEEHADIYFSERDRESRLAALASSQGKPVADPDELVVRLNKLIAEYDGKEIARPADWGGAAIEPLRIEFLEFRVNRLHIRTLYTKSDGSWQRIFLQP